jgi:small-conductance mechanosensitive channel
VWGCIVLLALDNLGVNISTLIAGLGVGGIAVALATQKILGDLFASLSIIMDRPFVVGDFLVLGNEMGTVENIGLKTTRVRSLSGEQLILSNSDLLSSRIRNYGRMFERRIVGSFGVTYDTAFEKIRKIPKMVKTAIEAQEKVRFDRAHFKSHGASSLDFEYVYYVLSPSYNTYMDIQQAINLELHRRFLEEKIEFAYPTQTVYLERPAKTA